MKKLKYYAEHELTDDNEIFNYFISSLRPGITDWEYFVNWNKVFKNTRDIEVTLNMMNYLIGKDDFDAEFKYLAKKSPEIIRMIPVLIVRNGMKSSDYKVVTVNGATLTESVFSFSRKDVDDSLIEDALTFVKKSGLVRIFAKDGVKNLVDYVIGVEAGLSSNGRKNRGGSAMESVCDALIQGLGIKYIKQASPNDIMREFGVNLPTQKGRRFDFAAYVNGKLFIIEVNAYSAGGSKLDKTASDYRGLQNELRGLAEFIWITDGQGWLKAKNPIRKSFEHNDYILNIDMVTNGALNEILGVAVPEPS